MALAMLLVATWARTLEVASVMSQENWQATSQHIYKRLLDHMATTYIHHSRILRRLDQKPTRHFQALLRNCCMLHNLCCDL
jgi:hypothetical protein